MQFSVKLKGTYCILLFNSSPALIHKLFEDGIYAIGAVWSNRKQVLKLKEDNKMPRGKSDFDCFKNIICCKWYGNKPVFLLRTNVDGMSGISNVMRQIKHLFLVLTSSSFTIKNSCYRLNHESKYFFSWRMFIDLVDVALLNSHIICTKCDNYISLLNFKIIVEKALAGRYNNHEKLFPPIG